MTFRIKLFIRFLLFALLPINIISVILFSISAGNIEDYFRQLASLYVSEVTLSLDNFEQDYDFSTRSVLTDPDILNILGNNEPAAMEHMIERQTKVKSFFVRMTELNPEIRSVTLFNTNQFYSWCVEPDAINRESLLQQPWLINNIEGSSSPFFISETHDRSYYSKDKTSAMMTIGRRLWNYNGMEIGVILFDIYPDKLITLSREFFELGAENNIQLFITDTEGRIIYDSNAITGKRAWEYDRKIEISDVPRNTPELLAISDFSSSGRLLAGIEIPTNKLLSRVGILRFIIFLVNMALLIVIVFLAARQSFKIDLPVRKLKQNMLQAHLHALQGQINPHMLYNTLESIRMKAVVNNQDQIAEMIKVLGRMFKHSLNFEEHDNFVLNELNYAKDYLYMQNIRYDNNFILEEHLSSSVLSIPVIPMVFQPIIENSVKHGFRGQSSRLHIAIQENIISASSVKITITDNGKGVSEEKIKEINAEKTGIGLRNLSERLRLRYGESSALKISSQEGLWFKVEFIMPLDNDILNNGLYNGGGGW